MIDIKESDTVFDVIKKRRNIRHFDGKKIPDDLMERILEAGRWAPSGANAQPWRFIVVICSDPDAGSKTYHLDAAIAGTNMTLVATSLGIGFFRSLFCV